ncbi:MAG: aspartate/tyrosine/aromatic aminotransferase [Propionibacteriaceae bacterium]|jgi:aromatic-amino-acid transaminase|nr:aspartate/tyrosine/aromatic aminotransferase [Propionibacteriaceae bacterium]
MTVFAAVRLAPRDPILGMTEAFNADIRPDKVNLGVGVYLDASARVPILECVRAASDRLAAELKPCSYLPIDGLPSYDRAVKELVFGPESALRERAVTVQGLGGTGALRIGAEFLRGLNPDARVLISDPSWENHLALFSRSGFQVSSYRYYKPGVGLDFAGMLDDLRAAAQSTIVVLHACCHNPTGYDLSAEQWAQVAEVVRERELVPFLDMAYQGFGAGIEADGRAVAEFSQRDVPLLVANSFSKSMSLYGERVGGLTVLGKDADEAARLASQLKVCVRTLYSNPPTHGASIAAMVLTDPGLRQLWESELSGMRDRIKLMRQALAARLQGLSRDFSFVTAQVGMFSYTGLSLEQMGELREKWAVYGLDSGRICVAAINDQNVDRVAQAIAKVL